MASGGSRRLLGPRPQRLQLPWKILRIHSTLAPSGSGLILRTSTSSLTLAAQTCGSRLRSATTRRAPCTRVRPLEKQCLSLPEVGVRFQCGSGRAPLTGFMSSDTFHVGPLEIKGRVFGEITVENGDVFATSRLLALPGWPFRTERI